MKTLHKIPYIVLFFALFLGFAHATYAATPSLSVNNTSNNAVQITVYGDPNYPVTLYYQNSQSYFQSAGVIGSTNSNGYFTLLTGNNYSSSTLVPGARVYVVVNGQTSSTVTWPYTNSGNQNYPYNGIVLNNANLTLSVGQSFTLTPNSYVNSLYVSNNSNSYVASAYVSGNQITLRGNAVGSTNVYICATTNNCATFYITVEQGTYNYPSTPSCPYIYPTYPYSSCQPSYQYQYPSQYPYQIPYQNLPPIIYYPTNSYPYGY